MRASSEGPVAIYMPCCFAPLLVLTMISQSYWSNASSLAPGSTFVSLSREFWELLGVQGDLDGLEQQ